MCFRFVVTTCQKSFSVWAFRVQDPIHDGGWSHFLQLYFTRKDHDLKQSNQRTFSRIDFCRSTVSGLWVSSVPISSFFDRSIPIPEPSILRFWIMVCSPVRDLPNSSFEISHFHDGIIVMNWSLDKHPIRCRVGIPIIQKYDLNSDSSIKDLFQWSWRVSIISVYVCPLSMIGASVSVVQSFS